MTAHILPHNYEMVRQVSAGPYAYVYLMRNKADGEEVIAKCVSLADISNEMRQSLKLARRIGLELKHHNIIHAMKSPMDDGEHIMIQITRYYNDRDLLTFIQKCKETSQFIPEESVWRCAVCLISAVAYLQSSHAKDNSALKPIAHKNIQPSNVLIDRDGNYVLTGFSYCVEMQETGLNLPETSDGTPKTRSVTYMAPETIDNKQWDGRVDVWGIGCTLYEMCTGMKYVEAVTPKFALKEITTTEMPPRLLGYSPDLVDLVGRMLLADFRKRPQISDLFSDERIQSRM